MNLVSIAGLIHTQEVTGSSPVAPTTTSSQLPLHLLWRQLLEIAGIKAGSLVDQHVEAAAAWAAEAARGMWDTFC